MFQYTVINNRITGSPVVCRLRNREQVMGWLYMRVIPKCTDRAQYGLRKMEQRAASVAQYHLFDGGADYLTL